MYDLTVYNNLTEIIKLTTHINFRMINPEIQVDTEIWKEIKPIDWVSCSDPIQKYPDLLRYLKTNPWRTMSGHSCTKDYMDKFKKMLDTEPEEVRCTIQQARNFVKLIILTPKELSAIRLADCLMVKIPFIKDKTKHIVSVEKKKEREIKPQEILRSFADYEGSLYNNISEDDILTEFEIEETQEMVQEWIKNGWYTPPPRPTPIQTPQIESIDRPINKLTKQLKRVRFDDKTKENDKPKKNVKTKGWPSKTNQGTQTKSWKELIQTELESDHYYEQLFNKSDTEHDSEDTIISN